MMRSPFKISLFALATLSFPMASWSMDLLQAFEAAKTNDASIRASRAAADAGHIVDLRIDDFDFHLRTLARDVDLHHPRYG